MKTNRAIRLSTLRSDKSNVATILDRQCANRPSVESHMIRVAGKDPFFVENEIGIGKPVRRKWKSGKRKKQ